MLLLEVVCQVYQVKVGCGEHLREIFHISLITELFSSHQHIYLQITLNKNKYLTIK
jgi:hypothetical protein